jgi:hypothetical protein
MKPSKVATGCSIQAASLFTTSGGIMNYFDESPLMRPGQTRRALNIDEWWTKPYSVGLFSEKTG